MAFGDASKRRTPGGKFMLAVLLGVALCVPLLAIYLLIYDRQSQSTTAKSSIVAGWGAEQTIVGPFLVVPFTQLTKSTIVENGKQVDKVIEQARELTIAPTLVNLMTQLEPERRHRSIYNAVVYKARVHATGRFELPDRTATGIDPTALRLDAAEVRFGISSAKGLGGSQPRISLDGRVLPLVPGSNLAISDKSGFLGLAGPGALKLGAATFQIDFELNGNGTLSLIPTAKDTRWQVHSTWADPSFVGGFLPVARSVSRRGFDATWRIGNIALNRPVATVDEIKANDGDTVTVALVDPVGLYDEVGRAAKYGLLFVGFTFLTLLMYDVIGGVQVSGVAYFLVGIALVLFFVLLLAFAEVIGFMPAYMLATGATIGLITAYARSILGSLGRAGVLGALLLGLYAVLYVLLSLEAYSLLIGSVLLFIALAVVMYFTRKVNWGLIAAAHDNEGTL